MQSQATPIRFIQITFSLAFLTLSIIFWHFNQAGQNIINLLAFFTLLIGLDNILIYYRCYRDKSSVQHQCTFLIFCMFILGIIFQNFNRSYGSEIWFNQLCKWFIITVLVLNFTYYAAVLIILVAYFVRQIYRLMTETLLSANANIDQENLNQFINKNKNSYEFFQNRNKQVNNSCSICLLEFENDAECILLPSCQHCFHLDCITEWLNSKSTCPYCRHNIQLDIFAN